MALELSAEAKECIREALRTRNEDEIGLLATEVTDPYRLVIHLVERGENVPLCYLFDIHDKGELYELGPVFWGFVREVTEKGGSG